MNKPVSHIVIETESTIEGFDPNATVDTLLLWELLRARCNAYPSLCDQVVFCNCGDEWHDAQIGLDGIDAIEEKHSEDLSDGEKAILSNLRHAFDGIQKERVKFRLKDVLR